MGIKKASTFAGFCKNHDNALFGPIDNHALWPRKQQVALYAYRCLCREYFVKENAIAVLDSMEIHPELDTAERSFLKAARLGNTLGFEGLKYHKKFFDAALRHKSYDEFEFTYFTSRSPCSLQLSGILYPDYNFLGNHLQDLGDWDSPLDLITFFTAPTNDGWAFGFAWHASSSRSCVPFIQSLASRVSDGERLEDALLRFSLSCCENHAIRISWWDGLADASRQSVVQRMMLMIHPEIPVPTDYLVAGCEDIADWSFEDVYTTLTANA